jgi:predicted DsbA family dithiol-disulfide isomerase
LSALGAEVGFAEGMRMHNTFDAQQLLHLADQSGRKHDLKQALFAAHFTDHRNLSDGAVLAGIAAEIGLDRAEALAALEDQRFADAVRAAETEWTSRGVQAVPAMIFNQRHLVSGAQGVETYTRILEQLDQMQD